MTSKRFSFSNPFKIGFADGIFTFQPKFHFYFLGCAPWYASLTALSMAYAVYIWVDARSE